MSLTFLKLFSPRQVANTPDSLAIVPSNSLLRNGRIRFVNTTNAFQTIKVWAVPSGNGQADSNMLQPVTSIGVNGFLDVDIPTLISGDIIYAQAGAANVITAHAMDGFLQST